MVKARELSTGTILDHIEKLMDEKMLIKKDIAYLKPKNKEEKKNISEIVKLFKKFKTSNLKPVFESLKGRCDYDTIRFARIFR